jgi:hypothetical protein
LAEKEGFEPPEPWLQFNGFQDRRIRPLCHFSFLVDSLFVFHLSAASDSYRDDRSAIFPSGHFRFRKIFSLAKIRFF